MVIKGEAAAAVAKDSYSEEREKRHLERVLKEQERRGQTLGKRGSRDEDGEGALPSGPRGDAGKRVKKSRGERRMSVRYEDELPR